MDVREIENIIDELHRSHPVLSENKTEKQLTFELLATFEDICSINVLTGMLNPAAFGNIINNLDAINQALIWISQSNLPNESDELEFGLSENRYKTCASFLMDYAYPYSVICSGYISLSRKRFDATVQGKTVTFNLAEDQNQSAWSDILREAMHHSLQSVMPGTNFIKAASTFEKFKKNVRVEDGWVTYSLTKETLLPFINIASEQWNMTKTLPETWKFDSFTLDEYRKVWITITGFCYLHFLSVYTIKDAFLRIKNGTIVLPKKAFIDTMASLSGVDEATVEKIVNYIVFEPSKRNVDIMYQPIVMLDNELIDIAPMLFIASQPERNLLAVVSTRRDSEYSKEVNDLEELMIQDLENSVPQNDSLKVVKHKQLGGRLPDIDFGLCDMTSNSIMLCELKWFAAADSTKEICAREDDITHGCEQSEAVMAFAMKDKETFVKRVFNVENGAEFDLFCCVVAKHNIRTQNKHVPVIDLSAIKNLFEKLPVNTVFHTIRNHEYEEKIPNNATLTHKEIKYGEFVFRIPAICFDSEWQGDSN